MKDLRDAKNWTYAVDPKSRQKTRFAIECGEWTITKFIVGAIPRFMLWRGKIPMIPIYDDAQAAREAAHVKSQEAA